MDFTDVSLAGHGGHFEKNLPIVEKRTIAKNDL